MAYQYRDSRDTRLAQTIGAPHLDELCPESELDPVMRVARDDETVVHEQEIVCQVAVAKEQRIPDCKLLCGVCVGWGF